MDVYVPDPLALAGFLKSRNIGTRPVYPPIHRQKIYAGPGRFPVAEHYCARGLWLPSASKLTDADVERVAGAIREFYHR
jgi:dTDP-4-amino-4,6-dideoxygalactose transaminase